MGWTATVKPGYVSMLRTPMPNHPNRSRRGNSAVNPTPEQIRAAREKTGLSQSAAAALIYCGLRGWQEWEAGNRRMHPGLWELFNLKAIE